MQAARTASAQALPELAAVPWRQPTDARWLRRWGRIWHAWTLLYTVPFIAAAVGMMLARPARRCRSRSRRSRTPGSSRSCTPSAARAWRGPRCARPAPGEPVAQGLLGDLLGHDERELQRATGLALERGALGVWLVGEGGALLMTPGGRRVHCFCVAATDPELPPSDRIAHLLLALRVDEEGFATVANHAFAGAPWRVRRRLPQPMRPALDAARLAAQ